MSSSVGERWTGWQPLTVVDPGCVLGEGDDQQAGMRLGLGEGGVVAAGAADQRAAGAAAAGRQQVAAAFAVEEGRAGQAADQAVGAVAAVELVGAGAGLDQVVLGAAVDRVVAEAAGEADAADRHQRAFDPQAVVAGAEVGHQPARRDRSAGQETCVRRCRRVRAAGADRQPLLRGDAEGLGRFVEGDDELVAAAAADHLQAGAAAGRRVELDVGASPSAALPCRRRWSGLWRPCSRRCPGRRRACRGRRRRRRWSSPGPPSITFACGLPIRVSRKAEPSRLSKPKSLSWPSPRALCGAQRGPDAAALAAGARGREGGDVALAGAAGHAVVAVVAVDEVFVAGAAVDDVDAEVAGDLVVVARRRRGPCRRRGRRYLVASPAPPSTSSLPRPPWIWSAPGPPQIRSLPRLPKIDVVAVAAPDHVALRRPADHVVAVGADDLRLPPVAARRLLRAFVGRRSGAHRERGERRRRPAQRLIPRLLDRRDPRAHRSRRLRRCGSASC